MIVRVIYSSILASVVVSCVFSFAVVGLIRASELRRANRGGVASAAYTVAALCGLAVCVAAVVYGLILVGQKS